MGKRKAGEFPQWSDAMPFPEPDYHRSMTITLYGITNCDTVRKARAWLAEQGVAYTFHDFAKQGVPPEHLDRWLASADGGRLLNRQGTTWRKLGTEAQSHADDPRGARALMLSHPSVIKRPVVEWTDGEVTVGFDAARWAVRKNA
jgi:arsenate reductase (glutaredoxin)